MKIMLKSKKNVSKMQKIFTANKIHNLLCKDTHNDRYSWLFDIRGGDKSVKEKYLRKAAAVLEIADYKTVRRILAALEKE
jgi:hypothetical protein